MVVANRELNVKNGIRMKKYKHSTSSREKYEIATAQHCRVELELVIYKKWMRKELNDLLGYHCARAVTPQRLES